MTLLIEITNDILKTKNKNQSYNKKSETIDYIVEKRVCLRHIKALLCETKRRRATVNK